MISVSELYSKNWGCWYIIAFQLFLIPPNVKYKCHKRWLHSYTVSFYRPEMEYGYSDFPRIHCMWLLLSVRKVSYFRSLQTKMEIDLPVSNVIKVYWTVLGMKLVDRHAWLNVFITSHYDEDTETFRPHWLGFACVSTTC